MRLSSLARTAGLLVLASCIAPVDSDVAVGPLSLSVVSGNDQSGPPGTELPNPIVARVEDSRGRAVKGQIVNFRVLSGGGSVFAGVAISGMDGVVQERWTLGASGPQRIEARAVDNTTGAKLTFATFNAGVTDVQAPVVTGVTTSPSTVTVGVPFDLTAVVSDAATGGSNIAGATFTLDGGGPTAMAAADGAFDQPIEAVRITIPPFASGGSHVFCVTGRDAPGNVSAASCITLVVAEDAVYVSLAGNDAASGSLAAPMRTIQAALNRAFSISKQRVNVAAGTYVGDVNLVQGVSLFGGYDPATWNRDPATFVSTISPGTNRAIGVMADHLFGAVTIDGFTIESGFADNGTGPGSSAYGILAINSLMIISGNHIVAHEGFGGLNGQNGTDGSPGLNGNNGGPGGVNLPPGEAGPQVSWGCFLNGNIVASIGGAGGGGGTPGSDGGNGATGSGVIAGGRGGAGGPGGTSSPLAPGQNGGDGLDGTAGSIGLGGGELGGIGGNRYQPADGFNGGDGQPGSGGGGGGGGGGINPFLTEDGGGNGGGSGGAGGCGGGGGTAGRGGVGSFGIFSISSTLEVTNNTIQTDRGDGGGNGAFGAVAGQGGIGGVGATRDAPTVGAGGNGGHGGQGGSGGHSGGGGGGPSIGIVIHGGSVTESGNTFVLGPAGSGGTSPAGGASNGANGVRANTRSF